MKRTILTLILMVSLLTGCGGAASNNAGSDWAPQENMTESMSGGSMKGDYDYGYDNGWVTEDSTADMPEAPESSMTGSDVSGSPLENAKIIYTADMTLETRDFDQAGSALTALVSSVGGYFESRELNQGGTYRSVYCVIRVPASRFIEFLDQAGEVAHMTYRNEYSENVSEHYYDLEARLTTQRTKLQRLQELLAKANDMADIITIESAISDTELQIEYLTGSLRKYDSLIDFSTIRLSLREVYRLSNEEVTPVTFGERLTSAFKRGLDRGISDLEDFVISLARNWLTLIIWAVIIAAAVVLIRRRIRRRRAAKGSATQAFWRRNDEKKTDDEQ